MERRQALELLLKRPGVVARWCGLERLTELHDGWMRRFIGGREDLTLLAHRGSYKTTCLAFSMAAMLLLYPRKNLLFLRKTDEDVVEVLRQVKMLLQSDVFRYLSACIYGEPVQLLRCDMHTIHTSCYAAPRGAPQLIGLGTGSSLTGKHADVVITDDIVNLQDRASAAERQRIRGIYQELQNIRNPGGRILNAGTPWHPEDAISLMPNVLRCDCWHTGLLDESEIRALQQSMTPSLFAANYELRHIPSDGALFPERPPFFDDPDLLRDGFAHLDAAYGGSDSTALTCGRFVDGHFCLFGRLWHKHVDDVMDEVITLCDHLRCGPIFCETNGDKGYVVRELRSRGALVRPYAEHTAKFVKIATWLRKWWPRVRVLSTTDRAYLDQILDYSLDAPHDDAPDSAASLLRAMGSAPGPRGDFVPRP